MYTTRTPLFFSLSLNVAPPLLPYVQDLIHKSKKTPPPDGDGRATAVALAEAGISTTLIADSAIFAMMARVNKVIVGAHAVLANTCPFEHPPRRPPPEDPP